MLGRIHDFPDPFAEPLQPALREFSGCLQCIRRLHNSIVGAPVIRSFTPAYLLSLNLSYRLSLLLCLPALAWTAENAVQISFEQRIRNENWNNLFDYSDSKDDQRNQVRFRSRVWVSVPVGSNITFYTGLVSETNKKIGTDLVGDEAAFEALYLDVKHVVTPKLSLRIGRQDIQRGDGFILSDATPCDGSRTAYLNAADLAWHAGRSTVEFLAIFDPARDRFLPRLNDQHRGLTEWDDKAAGVYVTHPIGSKSQVEGYYFYKTETGDRRAASNPQFQPDRAVHTWGGRTVFELAAQWTVSAEWARQLGYQDDGGIPIAAWAGYANVKRTFEGRGRPYLLAGYTAFSGDDPRTPRIEAWDPLFSRGARWGDLLLYSMASEKGIGYLTNARMPQLEAGWNAAKRLALRTTYYHLGALRSTRGELIQARGDFRVNDNWKAHVVYEHMTPGAFYPDRGKGYFLRFEISFLIRTELPR